MIVKIFGKPDCALCQTTKNKWYFLLQQLDLLPDVKLIFFDLDTVDGLAEGAFYAVTAMPTTLLENRGKIISRWDGVIPPTEEIQNALQSYQATN